MVSTPFPKTSEPAARALANAGYRSLEDLTRVTEADVLRLHGMGPKAVRILREAMTEKGLSFVAKK